MIQIDIHSKPFRDFDLQAQISIEEGEIAVVTGESGGGKSCLLNSIAGLTSTSGTIQIGNQTCLDTKINLKPKDRDLGYVFQESTLFPNMTVKQNLEYAIGAKANKELLDQYLQEVNLKEFYNRKPHQLSGGQKQRIDLIRSLVTQPKLLLLDEPANAQDQKNRKQLQNLLIKEKQRGLSIILVSHDPQEIHRLADKIYVMKEGRILDKSESNLDNLNDFEISGTVIDSNDGIVEVETAFGKLKVKSNENYSTGEEIKLKQKELNLTDKV